jgi:anhydro-N-acetylmuramic acid kinase
MNILGIMTGTSLDGMDFALANFEEFESNIKLSIIATHFFPYAQNLKNKIQSIISEKIYISEFSQLNFYLAHLFKDKYQDFLNLHQIDPAFIDCISIHGQTLLHNPHKSSFLDRQISTTLQATNLSALAKLTAKPVIGDFRSGDIALGGEGAPLVPIFDYDYFHTAEENRILLNIGGISNLTYLPNNCDISQVLAFDCGPGNMLIDNIANRYFQISYDKNGDIARSGKIDNQLLDLLLKDEFVLQTPPKSTGREKYNQQYIESAISSINHTISKEDILRTFTEFTAIAISQNIAHFANPNSTIIVSGGGRENVFFLELLQSKLLNANFKKIEDFGIPSDFKEAIAFAYLGYLNTNHKAGNITNSTGAEHPTILGTIALP